MRNIPIPSTIVGFPIEIINLFREIIADRRLNTGPAQPLVIASNAITISTSFSYFSIDTTAAASSTDLKTINGGLEGDLIFFKAMNDAHTVVFKNGTGNILCTGAADLSLDSSKDLMLCHFDGTNWKANLWNIGS